MATDAAETKKQENGSRVYFEAYIEKGERDTKKLQKLVERVYKNVSDSWMDSYAKQAAALKGYLGNLRGYKYSRDEGIMPFIEGIAKSKCGVSIKDRWNPADIYMVKSSKESTIKTKITKITASQDKKKNLLELNAYMRELLAKKELLPISLKAIAAKTKDAKIEPANMGGKNTMQFSLQPGSLKCLLSIGNKTPYEFDTGELAFDFIANGEPVHGQSRNFQYSKERNLVQTDLTPKGRSAGAKLGKVSSSALDTFLAKNGLKRPASASGDPNINPPGKWSESNIKYWIKLYNSLKNKKVAGQKIDFGSLTVIDEKGKTLSGIENVIRYAVKYEGKTRSSAGRFSSKLIGMRWAAIWAELEEKGKTEEWLKTLYFGAKKEFGEENGPFLKIY
jgi:hypothetical protein